MNREEGSGYGEDGLDWHGEKQYGYNIYTGPLTYRFSGGDGRVCSRPLHTRLYSTSGRRGKQGWK